MKLIILGDVHGDWVNANRTVKNALEIHPDAKAVIQLGDLGDGWPTKKGLNRWPVNFDLPIYVVDGNHENFDAIERGDTNPRLKWMPRGSIMELGDNHAMFMGGATSPDKNSRTIGVDWWPQETIRQRDVDNALNPPADKIDILFAHERASIFPVPSSWKLPMFEGSPGKSDREALSLICNVWKPVWYFHGHWHFCDYQLINHTNVVACPLIDSRHHWTVLDVRNQALYTNWGGETYEGIPRSGRIRI